MSRLVLLLALVAAGLLAIRTSVLMLAPALLWSFSLPGPSPAADGETKGEPPLTDIKKLTVFAAAALAAVILASCDTGGGATTTPAPAPPPSPAPSPLSWVELPEEIVVGRGLAETFVARLSEAVEGATYEVTSSGGAATVEGESPEPGVFEGTVTGVEAGEVTLTLTASHAGYETATGEIGVVVEDLFDLEFWRQMVFGAFACPTGAESLCVETGSVEERTVQVFPGRPDFVIVTGAEDDPWNDEFSESQVEEIEDAIRDTWEQLTGRRFTQTIRVSDTPARQEGWIDLWAANDLYTAPADPLCGSLDTEAGAPQGTVIFNASLQGCPTPRRLTMLLLGSALGFFLVESPGHALSLSFAVAGFSEIERYHARLAFALGRGAPYTDNPRADSE